jgi:hypothetical protein
MGLHSNGGLGPSQLAREQRDPFSAMPHLQDVDLVAFQRARDFPLLITQYSRQNQPVTPFQIRQNRDEQFAE